jgi:hypothetical protein
MADQLDPAVAQLSREVVGTLAPAELPMFNAVSREYAKDPERAVKAVGGKDEVLGFGVEVGLLLTPAVISVAEVVIKYIAGQALKLGEQAAGAIVEHKIKSVLESAESAKAAGSAASMVLTAEQLAEVRKVAINRALSLGLPHDQAERLADAMVARLATHPNPGS